MKKTKMINKFFAGVIAAVITATTIFDGQTAVWATDATTETETTTESGVEASDSPLSQEIQEYKNTIDGILAWAKSANGITADQPLFSGSFLKNAGTTAGDWYAIALSRLGYEEDYQAYLSALTTYVEDKYKKEDKLDATKATEWHRVSLAYLSTGGDPTYAGTDKDGKNINLIADGIYDFELNQGKALDAQGINGLVWALITLDSMRYDVPMNTTVTRTQLIQQILDRQNEDGGFALSGIESDPDVTAMVLQALAIYTGDNAGYAVTNDEMVSMSPYLMEDLEEAIDKALSYLSSMQQPNGDFLAWGTSNCETVCQTIIALCGLGIHPLEDERFIKDGNTLVDALMAYELEDGGFAHSLAASTMADGMASGQALCALTALCRYMYYGVSLYDYRNWGDAADTDVYTINMFTSEPVIMQAAVVFEAADEEAYKNIPTELTTEYTAEVNRLYNKLKNAENKDDYAHVLAGLRQMKEEIAEIQQEIDDINREIETNLYGDGELDAKAAVQLKSRVEYLSEYDQTQIEGYEDLLIEEKQLISDKRGQLLSILGVAAVVLIVGSVFLNMRHRKRAKKQLEIEE